MTSLSQGARQTISAAIDLAVKEGRTALTELESKDVLHALGVTTTRHQLTRTADEAVNAAEVIGYPVAMKIVSPAILHKTDAGCVGLNLADANAVKNEFERIMSQGLKFTTAEQIFGVVVQEMAPRGQEVIVGMKRDAVFGPTVLFGLGGVWVEVMKDVSLRVVPCSREEIADMLHEIRGFKLLDGYRGAPPADTTILIDIVERVAALAEAFPEIQEMDLNPVFVYETGRGAKVVDARILVQGKEAGVA